MPRQQRPPAPGRPGSTRARGAARRRARRGAAGTDAPRRPALTGRAALLALAVVSVVLALALPLKVFLSQRAAIGDLEQQTHQQQQKVNQLKAAQRQWQDPAYVAAQARERLHYVKPGETSYVVLGGGEPAQPDPAASAAPSPAPVDRPWYTQLWQSVQTPQAR